MQSPHQRSLLHLSALTAEQRASSSASDGEDGVYHVRLHRAAGRVCASDRAARDPPVHTSQATVERVRGEIEQQFRERYDILRRLYEDRLRELAASVQEVYSAVDRDETLAALRTDPTTSRFASVRVLGTAQRPLRAVPRPPPSPPARSARRGRASWATASSARSTRGASSTFPRRSPGCAPR